MFVSFTTARYRRLKACPRVGEKEDGKVHIPLVLHILVRFEQGGATRRCGLFEGLRSKSENLDLLLVTLRGWRERI